MRPLRLICLFTILICVQAGLADSQSRERCFSCRQTILFDYVLADGRFFHPGCFTCNRCNKIILDEYVVRGSNYYHPACADKLSQMSCSICGKPILDEYCEDYWGTTYCAAHVGRVPLCDFCRRPISGRALGDGVVLPDGRQLCGVCGPSAVTTEREAKILMDEAVSGLESIGIRVDCRDVTLLLLGLDKMKLLSSDRESHHVGYTDYAGTADEHGRMKCEAFNIYLLYGMPSAQMKATLVHELMHVWQFQHRIFRIDKSLCEGSCEYASCRVMEDIGTIECRFICRCIQQNPDPVYGGGFRNVKAFVEKEGFDSWLRKLEGEQQIDGQDVTSK